MIFIGSYWRVRCFNTWKWTHLTKYSFKIEWFIFELKHDKYKVVDCNACHPGTQGKGPTLTISTHLEESEQMVYQNEQ